MRIEQIEVINFKCFKELKIDLDSFNVIIGKNASGKSNIINIIKFIRDMQMYSIDDAIALQGGVNYLYNTNIKNNKEIVIRFTINMYDEEIFRTMRIIGIKDNRIAMIEKYDVEIKIKAHKVGSGYKIAENNLKVYYIMLEKKRRTKSANDLLSLKNYKKCESIVQECKEKDGKITEKFTGEVSEELKGNLKMRKDFYTFRNQKENTDNVLLINYLPIFFFLQMSDLENVKIYDFEPKSLKSASIINRKNVLEEDGSNIANVLQRILKNTEEKRKLLMILKKLLPFIEDISTEKSFNKSMYFRVKENNKNDLPSSLLSDGTVNIIAIIIALYFEKNNDVVVIEEPEKNIHPKLANQLVALMQDVGHKKQVIITTHNTQLLSSVDLKNIFYVYRNKDRYSEVERPEKNERVKVFIKNQLDVGDLFYEGLFTEKEV